MKPFFDFGICRVRQGLLIFLASLSVLLIGKGDGEQLGKNFEFNGKWQLQNSDLPSWAIGPFEKYKKNPILSPQGKGFESAHVYNPTVIVKDGRWYMFYRAQDMDRSKFHLCRSEIGLATSDDGLMWKRYGDGPVIEATEPYELPGGCEDPRLFEYQGIYHLWYTGFHPDSQKPDHPVDQCEAISTDLIHWQKLGIRGHKNDAILVNPSLEAVKVNGKFILYGDRHIGISDDLKKWDYQPLDLSKQIPGHRELCQAITNIPGHEDDIILLCAVHPDTLLRGRIDGSAVAKCGYDVNLLDKANQYVIVQARVSKQNPTKVLEISPPMLYPTEPYELEGVNGPKVPFFVVFINQGLYYHAGQWWLFYGGGDHVVAVAVAAGDSKVVSP